MHLIHPLLLKSPLFWSLELKTELPYPSPPLARTGNVVGFDSRPFISCGSNDSLSIKGCGLAIDRLARFSKNINNHEKQDSQLNGNFRYNIWDILTLQNGFFAGIQIELGVMYFAWQPCPGKQPLSQDAVVTSGTWWDVMCKVRCVSLPGTGGSGVWSPPSLSASS